MRARLRLWLSLEVPVDRRTYFTNGAGLMALKYGLDAAAVRLLADRVWTPLDYFSPLLTVRQQVLAGAPEWVGPGLILLSLPFLWIGVSMTVRRAVDAGRSPWLVLLFFLPGVNYLLMLALSWLPSAATVRRSTVASPPVVDDRLKSALLGVAAAVAITVPTLLIGVYLRRAYSAGLFLGLPFTIGYISSYIHNYRHPRWLGESLVVGMASVLLAASAVVLFALEGAACTLMALPVAAIVSLPGAWLGHVMGTRAGERQAGAGTVMALLAPLLVSVEPRAAPAPRHVVTVIEVDAPPHAVWPEVVAFPKLPGEREWLFRAGVAAPTGARIEGTGIGAVRYCDFTTGSFVEPIVAWEENRLLGFEITEQAPPLRELSPFGEVHPPHLDGYFRALYGEFRLEPLADNRTRLTGTTRYRVDMFPQAYWTAFADLIVAAIHRRVLDHVKALAES